MIKRGEIYYCNLAPVVGSEQSGIRPVVIIQNDIGNKFSPTVIIVPITSKLKKSLPTHINIDGTKYGLDLDSIILTEQIRTIDKSRLKQKIGKLDFDILEKIKEAIKINFSIRSKFEDVFTNW